MNFSRAKSYLIVIFAAVNLFLVINLFRITDSGSSSKASLEKTLSILNSQNIKADKGIFSLNSDPMFYLNLQNPLSEKEIFSSSFSYPVSVSDSGFVMKTDGFKVKIKSYLPSYKTSKILLNYLKELNIPVKHLTWAGTMDMGGGNFKASYIQTYEGHNIYNTSFYVIFNSSDISEIGGKYYIVESFSNTEKDIKPVYEILLRFLSDNKDGSCEIKKVETGYYIEENLNSYSLVSAIPCYKIFLSSGNAYYYDAVNSTLLKIDEF